MGYKWKPSKSQKEEYKRRLQEKEKYSTYTTPYPIRQGCYVEYYNLNQGRIITGHVTTSSYGNKTNQRIAI